MTTIVVTAVKSTSSVTLDPGVTYASTAAVVTDNSGAVLPAVVLDSTNTATLTGTAGPNEASVTFTDLDTAGNTIGTPVTVTESGTGGIPGTFFPTTSGTITVS